MVLKFLRNNRGFYRGQFVVLKDIDSISQLKNKNWVFSYYIIFLKKLRFYFK